VARAILDVDVVRLGAKKTPVRPGGREVSVVLEVWMVRRETMVL